MRSASAAIALAAALVLGCGATAAPVKKPPRPKILAKIRVGSEPTGITYGAGSVWAVNYGDGTVLSLPSISWSFTRL